MTAADIVFTGVAKRFGSNIGVEGVTWTGGGGVVGLLGPNGSGKSTLLRMVATVLAPDEGDIRLLGHDPSSGAGRLAIRRHLGYLPQRAVLYPGFSAFDLVDYVAVLKEMSDRRVRRDEVRRVLTAVGLVDVMHKRLRNLSDGMQRRVALAASLLGRPKLVVLDEPAAGLDPSQRLQLREVLAVAGREATVVMSTHHTDDLTTLCRRVLVLDRGRLCFDGTPHALAEVAFGRVWTDGEAHPSAVRSWVTGAELVRNIGDPPSGAQLVDPTIDDGYLLLTTPIGVPT